MYGQQKLWRPRRVARRREGAEDFPPVRLKKVQFALNIKRALFGAMP